MKRDGVIGVRNYTAAFGVTIDEPVDCTKVANDLLEYSRRPNSIERGSM